MKTEKYLQLSVAILFICWFSTAGFADETTNFGKRVPNVEEVVSALVLPEGYKARGLTRSVRPAISIEINFEYDSYKLTQKAVSVLDVVGKSLNTERLKNFQFTIEGHTDASGTDEYNMNLSRKRAETVKKYLTRFGVKPGRLSTIGKGERELLFPDSPHADRNRRVKIVNEGGQE